MFWLGSRGAGAWLLGDARCTEFRPPFSHLLPALCVWLCLPRSSLYPNVDFYSGIVLRALGIPVEMYTVLFAMARTVGWVAQVSGRAGGQVGGW